MKKTLLAVMAVATLTSAVASTADAGLKIKLAHKGHWWTVFHPTNVKRAFKKAWNEADL